MKKITLLLILAPTTTMASAKLPEFALKDINGNTVNTAELQNDGRPIIISFFATWCKPCMRELEAITDNYIDWQEETGVKMILVSIDQGQNIAKVKPLVDSKGWDYEVLLDPNSEFLHALQFQMVPSLVILDGAGNVVESHTGYTDGSEENIIEILRKL